MSEPTEEYLQGYNDANAALAEEMRKLAEGTIDQQNWSRVNDIRAEYQDTVSRRNNWLHTGGYAGMAEVVVWVSLHADGVSWFNGFMVAVFAVTITGTLAVDSIWSTRSKMWFHATMALAACNHQDARDAHAARWANKDKAVS